MYKHKHKEIQIGQTKPRGQHKKNKSALDKQADYASSTDSSSSSSSEHTSRTTSKKPAP